MNSEHRPLDSTIASMMAALSKLQEETDRLAAKVQVEEEAHQENEERFAQRAREGQLGAEWQRLQQRIDAGETTRQKILSGEDSSSEARFIQQTFQQNLTKMRKAWEKEREEGKETILDDLERLRGALQRGPIPSFLADDDGGA